MVQVMNEGCSIGSLAVERAENIIITGSPAVHVGPSLPCIRIARICHSAMDTYRESIGERPFGPWEKLPEWRKRCEVEWVENAIANPGMTPKMAHDIWVSEYSYAGWTFGPVRDVKNKKHPCLVRWDRLPGYQKLKDELFLSVARTSAGTGHGTARIFSDSLMRVIRKYSEAYHKDYEELIRDALRIWKAFRDIKAEEIQ